MPEATETEEVIDRLDKDEATETEEVIAQLNEDEVKFFTAAPARNSRLVHSVLDFISIVAGAQIVVGESGKVNVASGSQWRALKYLRLSQRAHQGWIASESVVDDGDLTSIEIPEALYSHIGGKAGEKLQLLSQDHEALMFFIDDKVKASHIQTSAKVASPATPPKPSAPWLAEGKRVEVKGQGDIQSECWKTGIVRQVLHHGKVVVQLDDGLELTGDETNMRPWYECGDLVEYNDTDGQWIQATVDRLGEDGTVLVQTVPTEELHEDVFTPQELHEPLQVDRARLRPCCQETIPSSKEANEETSEETDDAQKSEKESKEEKEARCRIAIFGESLHRRCNALLRIMKIVERQRPGFFRDDQDGSIQTSSFDLGAPPGSDWGAETCELEQDKVRKLVGTGGYMCKKCKIASACGLEYLDDIAFIVGQSANRSFCKGLIEFLMMPKESIKLQTSQMAEYCDILEIPPDSMPKLIGKQRAGLNRVEDEAGVIVIFEGSEDWKSHDKWSSAEWKETAEASKENDAEEAPEAVDDIVAAKAEDTAEASRANEAEEAPEAVEEKVAPKADDTEDHDSKHCDAEMPVGEMHDSEIPAWQNSTAGNVTKALILAIDKNSRIKARMRCEGVIAQDQSNYPCDNYELGLCHAEGFGTDVIAMDKDIAGSMRDKPKRGKIYRTKALLEAASGCSIEFIGGKVVFMGIRAERDRGREYFQWVMDHHTSQKQRELCFPADVLEDRSDLTIMHVTTEERERIYNQLTTIEQDTSVLILFPKVHAPELMTKGSHILLQRGGHKVIAEVVWSDLVKSDDQDDGQQLDLSLRICQAEDGASVEKVENDAVQPVYIFGCDAGDNGVSGRAAAARKLREYLDCSAESKEELYADAQQMWKDEPSYSYRDTGSWSQHKGAASRPDQPVAQWSAPDQPVAQWPGIPYALLADKTNQWHSGQYQREEKERQNVNRSAEQSWQRSTASSNHWDDRSAEQPWKRSTAEASSSHWEDRSAEQSWSRSTVKESRGADQHWQRSGKHDWIDYAADKGTSWTENSGGYSWAQGRKLQTGAEISTTCEGRSGNSWSRPPSTSQLSWANWKPDLADTTSDEIPGMRAKW